MIAAAEVDVDWCGQPDHTLASMLAELTARAVAHLRSAPDAEHEGLSAYIWLHTDRFSDECGLMLVIGDDEYRNEMTPDSATRLAMPCVTSTRHAADFLASTLWRDLVIDNRMMHRALVVGSTRPY